MGIQSRDYYRKSGNSALADWGIYQMTPVVKYLIIVNVIVWVLQTVWTHDSRLSMLDNMRRVDPRLDKFLQEHGDDPEALEKFKRNIRNMPTCSNRTTMTMAGIRIARRRRMCRSGANSTPRKWRGRGKSGAC